MEVKGELDKLVDEKVVHVIAKVIKCSVRTIRRKKGEGEEGREAGHGHGGEGDGEGE